MKSRRPTLLRCPPQRASAFSLSAGCQLRGGVLTGHTGCKSVCLARELAPLQHIR